MGYETELTPPQKDGGRDIVASRIDRGHRTSLRIECKNSVNPVDVSEVRALYGVIEDEKVEKGILVGTMGFTTSGRSSASSFARRNSRLELVSGDRLSEMLSQTFTRSWPTGVDKLIHRSRQRASRES